MKNQYELETNNIIIASVNEDSIAEEIGLEPGDRLVSINNNIIADELDFYYYTSFDEFILEVEKTNNEIWEIEVEKEPFEDLGINLVENLDTKRCVNHCVFCFIDQMPTGMRESLYIKDDDERLSFLNGNYVTLTNLDDQEIDRICKWKIPVNISVHTTDLRLRQKMLGNIKAKEILNQLQKLTDNNVEYNTQIVLVPEMNDKTLKKTILDLTSFLPSLKSISIVPVGLTKHRDNLKKLRTFTKDEAKEIIETIEEFQKEFIKKYNDPIVFASDEFYLLAEKEFPNSEIYNQFNQLENGVGMITNFINEFLDYLNSHILKSDNKKRLIATGKLFYPTLDKLIKLLKERYQDINIDIVSISNEFFGKEITVAGLLTGIDLINQLEPISQNYDEILVSDALIRNNTEILLDDISLSDLETKLKTKFKAVPNDGGELIKYITGVYDE